MRKRLSIGILVCSLLLLASLNQASVKRSQDVIDDYSAIQIGFQIAPVRLNLSGKNASLVGLGSYLVNGPSECLGCHIVQPPYLTGNNPHLGEAPTLFDKTKYLSGGRAFGAAISRNLTPDKHGLPAGLTYDQFEQAMRYGVDFKALLPHVPSSPGLLQVMPWPQYQWFTKRRLKAIYEYLRAIPCIEGGPGMPLPPDKRC